MKLKAKVVNVTTSSSVSKRHRYGKSSCLPDFMPDTLPRNTNDQSVCIELSSDDEFF